MLMRALTLLFDTTSYGIDLPFVPSLTFGFRPLTTLVCISWWVFMDIAKVAFNMTNQILYGLCDWKCVVRKSSHTKVKLQLYPRVNSEVCESSPITDIWVPWQCKLNQQSRHERTMQIYHGGRFESFLVTDDNRPRLICSVWWSS